jgi:hypothetical protein
VIVDLKEAFSCEVFIPAVDGKMVGFKKGK